MPSRTSPPRADDLVEPASALPDQRGHLAPVDQVRSGRRADHGHHVDPGRQVFQQRPDRGDPDPGGKQHHPVTGACVVGEHAVGPFDGNPGARPQADRRPALVAEPLDRDPDVGRLGQGGQRVRVPLPPQLPGQETPQEELAAR